jgi:hypothetical protein
LAGTEGDDSDEGVIRLGEQSVEKVPGRVQLDSSLRWNDDYPGPLRPRHPCEGRGPGDNLIFQRLIGFA